MKQKYKSLLEAICSFIVAIALFIFTNDSLFKYALPITFILLGAYKIHESIDFKNKK